MIVGFLEFEVDGSAIVLETAQTLAAIAGFFGCLKEHMTCALVASAGVRLVKIQLHDLQVVLSQESSQFFFSGVKMNVSDEDILFFRGGGARCVGVWGTTVGQVVA